MKDRWQELQRIKEGIDNANNLIGELAQWLHQDVTNNEGEIPESLNTEIAILAALIGNIGNVARDSFVQIEQMTRQRLGLADHRADVPFVKTSPLRGTGQMATDMEQIKKDEWVSCWICAKVFTRRREAWGHCYRCERGFCEGEHGDFPGGVATCVICSAAKNKDFRRAGRRPRLGEFAEAIARMKAVPIERAMVEIEQSTDEQRKIWRSDSKIRSVIASIRAEAAVRAIEEADE